MMTLSIGNQNSIQSLKEICVSKILSENLYENYKMTIKNLSIMRCLHFNGTI